MISVSTKVVLFFTDVWKQGKNNFNLFNHFLWFEFPFVKFEVMPFQKLDYELEISKINYIHFFEKAKLEVTH